MSSISTRNGAPSSNLNIEPKSPERASKWHHRFSKLFGRDDVAAAELSQPPLLSTVPSTSSDPKLMDLPVPLSKQTSARSRFARQVIPGLPRPATFRRQMSERRERLSPSDMPHSERRTVSVDRRRAFSTRPASPSAFVDPRTSAPAFYNLPDQESAIRAHSTPSAPRPDIPQQANMNAMLMQRPTNPPTPPPDVPSHVPGGVSRRGSTAIDVQAELESRWILNLSMHFRDKSPREKFFVTYAETPTRWRRVTVSCDYRNAPSESLEADLHGLTYQRDKSTRIYEAIRTSLPDIQFYDTVTNLRLETSADDRLHVHVTEDVNEIIPYPDKHVLGHLKTIPRIAEEKVHFLNHMSGFVYKVRVDGETLIKKEIPGPDSVEEFLYEINALSALVGSKTVVQIRGLVVDDETNTITGLLIDYYEKGPLVDILFDDRGSLTWGKRGKWALQIIQGLTEIHEAGFVQGDFTVSNICVGADDNARIIDINRRGCPVGWEPPEIAAMIESGQRISMYIGVKSDIFQLGMVLWAIANEDDEPERRERPLRLTDDDDGIDSDPAPSWFRLVTHLCLEPQPSRRPSANKLLDSALALRRAPPTASSEDLLAETTAHTWASASTAVPTLNLSRYDDRKQRSYSTSSSIDEPRGRSPPRNTAHLGTDWHWNHPQERSSQQSSFRQDDDRPQSPRSHAYGDEGEAEAVEPEIVPIDPTGEGWREVTVDGRGYIVRDDHYDARPDSDSDEDCDCDESNANVVVGEDAFGRHSLHAPLPPAPEVPRAPDPPSALTSLPRAFRHIDSGLGDMNVSDDLQHHYRDFELSSANHGQGYEGDCSAGPGAYHFRHHDSGLGDMDLDHDIDHSSHLPEEDQHAHRSGRRTWSWKKAGSASGIDEREALPEVSEGPGVEWQDVSRRDVGDGGETESEQGEHHGGVPLGIIPEQHRKADHKDGVQVKTSEALSNDHIRIEPQSPKDEGEKKWAASVVDRLLESAEQSVHEETRGETKAGEVKS